MRELRTAQRGYDWLRGATVDVIGSDERRECKVKVGTSVEPKIYSNIVLNRSIFVLNRTSLLV